MNLPKGWIIAASAAIVAGAGLVALLRQQATSTMPAPASLAPTLPVTASLPAAASPPTLPQEAASPAPWALAPQPSPFAAPAATTPEQRQAMLARLKVQSRQQAALTDRLLAELDRREAAHAVPAGVDINAVRNNLLVSRQLQQISLQLQDLAAQPDSPERRTAMQSKLARIQELQRQVRLDLSVPGAAKAGTR